jgi:hypothetical protein
VVCSVDYDAVLALPVPGSTTELVRSELRWLVDADWLRQFLGAPLRPDVPHERTLRESRLTQTDFADLGPRYDHSVAREDILSWCSAWGREEEVKGRTRHILEPHLNDRIPPEAMRSLVLPSMEDMSGAIVRAQRQSPTGRVLVVSFDYASWYDQLPIGNDCGAFFGVLHREGVAVARMAPTGFRPVCGVADAITGAILEAAYTTSEVDRESIFGDTYIDNVYMIAPDTPQVRGALKRLAAAFLLHSYRVGAILNGWDTATLATAVQDLPDAQALDALLAAVEPRLEEMLAAETADILGARYDLVAGARGLTETTKVKVRAARQLADDLQGRTRRQLAAIFGLLLYASRVACLAPQLPRFYDSLSYFRRLASLGDAGGWDGIAPPFRECESQQLRLWLDLALTAPPSSLLARPADLTIISDASAWGVGAVAVSATTGTAQTMSVPWSEADRIRINTESSVSAEPAGVLKALCRFLPPSFGGVVDVAVDHQPLVFAAEAGMPRARVYAACLAEVAQRWPLATVRFFFVAGEDNPADPYSRGRVVAGVSAVRRGRGDEGVRAFGPALPRTPCLSAYNRRSGRVSA